MYKHKQDMQAKAVELNNINLSYNQVQILNNINMNIKEKDFLGIIGPNGGGKTSLLKTIMGLIKPDSGQIRVFGRDVRESKGQFGYVPQVASFSQQFPVDVEDVILMGRLKGKLKLFKNYTEEDKIIVDDILEKLNLYEFKERQIGQLSGGQLQKVLIGRALAVQPKVLVLDEPTASIDVRFKKQIFSLLKALNDEMTVIVVTHDIQSALDYADRIVCLNQEIYYSGNSKIDQEIIDEVYGLSIKS